MPRSRKKVVVRESTGSKVLAESRVRLLCVGVFLLLCFGSLEARLVEMMIRRPAHATATAASAAAEPEEAEVHADEPVFHRADITDRDGRILATSVMTASAFANPREIRDAENASARLAAATGIPREALLTRLKSGKSFVWIKRWLTPGEQQAVNTLGIPGVYFLPEERRIYPYGNLFAHAVGYVGVDNKGLAGTEKYFDQRLSETETVSEPLALSLDARVQYIVREETKRAMDAFHAGAGVGMVVDVRSGELISMVSLPDFDPHHPAAARDEEKFNRAALGTYEMGSTFKSFTMALALEEGTASLKRTYDATGPLHFANFTISDAHGKHRWLSVPEIYAYSSNVGTARMLLDIGGKRQRAFLDKLGMMKPIALELPERPQPLYPKEWRDINAITIAYGHGISVTPLHLLRGIAALVGGGTLTPLTLVKDGNAEKPPSPRIISSDTSQAMRRLMRLVVLHGTGGKANIAGYRVGGKTGTAEKVQAGGGYSHNDKIASFIGTFPADNPHYAVLVMVDGPKPNAESGGNATGGWVAAPAVGRIVARMAPLMNVMPALDMAEDAEKYWVNTEPSSSPSTGGPAIDAHYVHAASLSTR